MTTDVARIHAEYRAFAATRLGGLFRRFENAHARAWQTDSREAASHTAMKRDWATSDAARDDLIAALKQATNALEFYANPEIYAPHPHGPAFDRRDLSATAKAFFEALPIAAQAG